MPEQALLVRRRGAGSSSRSPSPSWRGAAPSPAALARQQREAVVEAPDQLVEVEAAELAGRQLERQRHVVEPAAQLDHRRVGRVPVHPRLGGPGPLDEQRRRPRRGAGRAARRARRPRRAAPGWWPGCAPRRRCVQHPVDELGRRWSSTCSQLSSTSRTGRFARWSATPRSTRTAAPSTPAASATARVTSACGGTGDEVDEHDAVGVLGLQAVGDRQGDGRLADPSGAGDRHQRRRPGPAR